MLVVYRVTDDELTNLKARLHRLSGPVGEFYTGGGCLTLNLGQKNQTRHRGGFTSGGFGNSGSKIGYPGGARTHNCRPDLDHSSMQGGALPLSYRTTTTHT